MIKFSSVKHKKNFCYKWKIKIHEKKKVRDKIIFFTLVLWNKLSQNDVFQS